MVDKQTQMCYPYYAKGKDSGLANRWFYLFDLTCLLRYFVKDRCEMIYRKKKDMDFVQIDNALLRNKELSLTARGLMAYMLTFPDNKSFTISKLEKETNTKRGKLRTALEELIANGYVIYQRKCGGGEIQILFDVYEEPTEPRFFDGKGEEIPFQNKR